eukprot:12235399-Alexandrium_andersonii.AAC.1
MGTTVSIAIAEATVEIVGCPSSRNLGAAQSMSAVRPKAMASSEMATPAPPSSGLVRSSERVASTRPPR